MHAADAEFLGFLACGNRECAGGPVQGLLRSSATAPSGRRDPGWNAQGSGRPIGSVSLNSSRARSPSRRTCADGRTRRGAASLRVLCGRRSLQAAARPGPDRGAPERSAGRCRPRRADRRRIQARAPGPGMMGQAPLDESRPRFRAKCLLANNKSRRTHRGWPSATAAQPLLQNRRVRHA